MTATDKYATIQDLRRKAMAAMETGNPQVARTIVRELTEYDFTASTSLRADLVASYGVDL